MEEANFIEASPVPESEPPKVKVDIHYDRQRVVHWSKPVWWDRVKDAAGVWTATAHYGRRISTDKWGKKIEEESV